LAFETGLPKSAVAKREAARWNRSESGLGLRLAEVATLEDARARAS
jgi:hypothetical protein